MSEQQTIKVYELGWARTIAIGVGSVLVPWCDVLHIAGSIRRKKPHVHDIEIVCLPKRTYAQESDLFGNKLPEKVFIRQEFVDSVLSLGKVLKGQPRGRMMQIEMPAGIKLDLFMPEPYDYYRILAIRTGSASYAKMFIAEAWKRLGWCGTENGLRRIGECEEIKLPGGKSKWVCKKENPTMPPVWVSEEEFFKWLQVPYQKPELRNL